MLEKDRKLDYIHTLNGVVRHDVINQTSIIDSYALLLEEGKDSNYVKKIILASARIRRQLMFLKECEIGIGLNWIPFKKAYSSCEKPSKIKVRIEDAMNNLIIYSSPLISKVFENLLDNSDRHGEASKAKIYYQIREDNLIVIYEDNGKGIPSEDKDMIFKEGVGKNTGMGMFLAKEILDITDIKISEVGEFGKGVKFELKIPKGAYKIE